MTSTETSRRDWDWDQDGELDGMYVETRRVTIKNGPSAGTEKLIFDFHDKDDNSISVWEAAVIKSRFREELRRRGKQDFELGERIRIKPAGKKEGVNGTYRDFAIAFEHAAPKPTAADLLGDDESATSFGEDDLDASF